MSEAEVGSTLSILVLDTGNEWGGGTNSLIELLKRIDRKRFSVTACFYNDYPKADSSLSRELSSIDIPLVLLPPLRQPLWAKLSKEIVRGLLVWCQMWRKAAVFFIEQRWRIAPRAKQLVELVQDGGFRLLYVNNQPSSNLEAYLAAEKLGVPLIQHCRIEANLNDREVAVVNRVARAVICVSHGVAESLEKQGVIASKLAVVCNAIDGQQLLPPPEPLPDLPKDAIVIGTVGSLIKRKAVDHLLRAVAILGDARVHVLVVGAGPEKAVLCALAAEIGIDHQVHFVGFQKTPLSWIAAMDMVVLSSAREGLPRVVLEAMLLSKPVIASRVVGSRELVVDGGTGYLYDYGDIATLAERLQILVANPNLRQRFGCSGRERVLQDYSIERYVVSVETILASGAAAGAGQ